MNPKYAKRSETTEQIAVIQWCEINEGAHPELKLLYHVPNGGSRNKLEAANLKRQGVKAGVPDLAFPVPKGKYIGLYIEMKYGANKETDNQKQWLRNLKAVGHFVAVCYTAEATVQVINEYIHLGSGAEMKEDGKEYPVLGKEK